MMADPEMLAVKDSLRDCNRTGKGARESEFRASALLYSIAADQ